MPDCSRHPCFDDAARQTFGRVHLPVAPECNLQCNFCQRIYDCANESRPGVTSAVLTPPQALRYLGEVLRRDPRIAVAGIAGPGDPFATPDRTLETLRLVRRQHPGLLLCVASNGLNVAPYAGELAALEVGHVTLSVNAVDARVGARIYAWVRHQKRVYRGPAGAELVWSRQAEALSVLKARGVTVKINIIIIPGINDDHVPEIARQVAARGADIANCVPLYPVQGTPLEAVVPPPAERLAVLRAAVAEHLPVMAHCTRCRADAVGLLGEPMPARFELALLRAAAPPAAGTGDTHLLCDDQRCASVPASGPFRQEAPIPFSDSAGEERRPCVAVATREGMLVNEHLGAAARLAIYGRGDRGFQLIETRSTPPAGGGRDRWLALARSLHDCRALLAASAGPAPCSVLAEGGIQVILMEGLIEEGLESVYRGTPIRAPARKEHRCGSGCAGNGQGCA
jgi:nitrogen fixation protein NifB